MKNFIAVENHSQSELNELIELAFQLKNDKFQDVLKNKSLVSMFFNPSTRTKISFDFAMQQLGGHSITIEPGKSSWGIEIDEGTVMDGVAEEHLKDATKVLNKYADGIAIRCFPQFVNWEEEKQDKILNNMVKWSDKPIVNMETITHPCQALAMMMTIKEKMKSAKKKKFVLTWGYHPKPLNTAVANSAGVAASIFGMDVVVANPPGYDLDDNYLEMMKSNCEKHGGSFTLTHNMEEAMQGADFVYVKSWGALNQYGNFNKEVQDQHKDWIVDKEKMDLTNDAFFSHCLPVRRNMLVTDEVIDSEKSLVYEEAENRIHVQKAILCKLLGEDDHEK